MIAMPLRTRLARVSRAPASPQEEAIERALRPAPLDEYVGQEKIREPARDLHRGGAQARARRSTTCCCSARRASARPRSRTSSRTSWASTCARPRGRCSSAPGDLAALLTNLEPQRRAVHRRDPSALAGRRGDPLSGAGGLPDRHHDRRGPGGALDQARPAAVHAGRRDHARRHADQSAARPLRHRRAARVLHAGGADAHRARARRSCSRSPIDDEGALEIARRSRGTPRIANRLLRRVRDFAEVQGRRRRSRGRSPTPR